MAMMLAVHGLKFEDVLDDAKPDSSEFVQAEISSVQNPCWLMIIFSYILIYFGGYTTQHTHTYIYIILGMIAIHRNPY